MGIVLLKSKGEAFTAFKQFKSHAETQTGEKLRPLRDDKGGEYISKAFDAFCMDHEIDRQHSVRNRL